MTDEKEINEKELWEAIRKIHECCKHHLFDDPNGYRCFRCPFYLRVHGYDGCVFDKLDRGVSPVNNWYVY